MMTIREAFQRLGYSKMKLCLRNGGTYLVTFSEDSVKQKDNTYLTDDLEDAVIQGSRMRLRRCAAI